MDRISLPCWSVPMPSPNIEHRYFTCANHRLAEHKNTEWSGYLVSLRQFYKVFGIAGRRDIMK